MSRELTSWVWAHSKATGTDKFVLLAIAEHVGSEGVAWPSNARLRAYTGLSERSIRRSIDVLVKLGELAVLHQGGPGRGDRRPNLYRVLTGGQIDRPQGSTGGQFVHHGGPNMHVTGGQIGPLIKNRTKDRTAAARLRVVNGVDPANRDTWLGGQLPDE